MQGAVSVTAMQAMLVAKFKSNQSQPPPEPIRRLKGQPTLAAASSASEYCCFCHKVRVCSLSLHIRNYGRFYLKPLKVKPSIISLILALELEVSRKK